MPPDSRPAGRRLPFLLVAALLVLATTPQVSAQQHRVQAAARCTALFVRNDGTGGMSRVSRVELPGATSTELRRPPIRIDALGYAEAQERSYGVTRSGAAVTVDRDGRTSELGAIRLGDPPVRWDGLGGATAGAVAGERWYVLKDGFLYTVDVSPRSRTYLEVRRATALAPVGLADVGDFDVHPRDGSLYGVSVSEHGDVTAVRIDIDSGRISPDRNVQLPGADTFGSMTFGPDGSGYLVADSASGSTLYRLPGRTSGDAAKIGMLPPSATSDMAGCLGPPRPPAPPPPPPEPPQPPQPSQPTEPPAPPTTPEPPATPTTTAPVTTAPADGSPRPPTATPPASVAPPMRPPPARADRREASAEPGTDGTAKKRRWGLTVLLLVFGGAAAVRAAGRRR